MTYKVTYSSNNNYSLKTSLPQNYKANLSYKIEIMPQKLDELIDVEISGTNDKYVLMYDAPSGKWKDKNPDEVLSAAASVPDEDGINYTLPTNFENKLDIDLDNRIDLDGGSF